MSEERDRLSERYRAEEQRLVDTLTQVVTHAPLADMAVRALIPVTAGRIALMCMSMGLSRDQWAGQARAFCDAVCYMLDTFDLDTLLPKPGPPSPER